MLQVLTRLADALRYTVPQIDTQADGGTHICLLHDLKCDFLVSMVMAETPALWAERASSQFPVLTPSPAM